MKRFRKIIPGLALLLGGAIGRLVIAGAKDGILIKLGSSGRRALVWAAYGAALLGLGLTLLPLLSLLRERRKPERAQALIEKFKTENRRRAPLSNRSGRYNEEEIRDSLSRLFDTMPAKFTPYLQLCQAQLDQMNCYQARLSRMLEQNSADDLTEAEALLDKLEQNIFGMMRKVFDWLTMYDASSPEEPLLKNLTEAEAYNEKALEQAGRLWAAITEYINSQASNVDVTGSVKHDIELLKEELI